MAQDVFARRLLITMRELAREVGHPSAYPATREGQLAALRQRLRMMEHEPSFSDFQRSVSANRVHGFGRLMALGRMALS